MKWPLVWRSTLNKVKAELDKAHADNAMIRADLIQAQKNDMPRNPRNGRWTSKPSI